MASPGSSKVPPLAPSQGNPVVGTANLAGINANFRYKKKSKKREERVLCDEYKPVLIKQVQAMIDQGCNCVVWTELNKNWFEWLDSELQKNPRFQGWTLRHDGLGNATMRSPETLSKDDPVPVKVYDATMLAEDPAGHAKLDWRTILRSELQRRDKPEHPTYHLSGLHIYAGRGGDERNSAVNEPQKRRIATNSMLREFIDNPSNVAGLGDGTRVQIYVGDWNLDKAQMQRVCNLVLASLRKQDGPGSRIGYDMRSTLNNRDWIVCFNQQGLVLPSLIANSSEHEACYSTSHQKEHLPVIVHFGAIQSAAERQENDVPSPPRGIVPTIEDVKAVEGQLSERDEALL